MLDKQSNIEKRNRENHLNICQMPVMKCTQEIDFSKCLMEN